MSIINDISDALQRGKKKEVTKLVQQAIDEGIDATTILKDGLLSGMNIIGEKFKNDEVFVPEVLVAARERRYRSFKTTSFRRCRRTAWKSLYRNC